LLKFLHTSHEVAGELNNFSFLHPGGSLIGLTPFSSQFSLKSKSKVPTQN
jgi:hypothetical protein